jgi:hypothetical protein
MNCLEYQEILQRQLDGEHVDEGRAAREHLAECLDCRNLQQAAELMLEQLRVQPVAMPPAGLTRKIVGRVASDRKNRLGRGARVGVRLGRYLAMAAAVLLAILTGLHVLTLLRAPVEKEIPPLLVKNDPAPSLEKSVEDARQAVASLTDKSKDHVLTLLSVANPMENNAGVALPAIGDMQQPLEPAAASLRRAGQGMSEGLQTVATSTQRAFAYFVREFTPADGGKQKDSRVN